MPDNSGYVGIGPEEGNYVPEDKAFEFAFERCLHGNEEEIQEFREMLVDWYFSGNWIRKEEDDIYAGK